MIRTHSTSGARTNPSAPPSSVYYSLYVALITLLFGNNLDPAALSPSTRFPPLPGSVKKRRGSFIRNEWALHTVVFWTTTHSAYGALYQSRCRNVSPFVYDIAGSWGGSSPAMGRCACVRVCWGGVFSSSTAACNSHKSSSFLDLFVH